MADARKDKRTLLSLKIRYKSATLEDFIERYSSDISRGGVFIKAKKPLAVGTLLKFEFTLQDQSSLIHGVGRVVWRREEADANNPPGMGIKFIKMDAESRAVVERVAGERARPGVFDHGKDGEQLGPELPSDSAGMAEEDRTKVRHVSEFLASALDEGRAVAARGAFSASVEQGSQNRHAPSDAPARGAMSAFGGSGLSANARISSAAAPAMDAPGAYDDFFDEETTKIREHFDSSFPADAEATVIAKDAASPFVAEKRPTPVAPGAQGGSRASAVPDLFDSGLPASFGPAPGEVIDTSLLDPAVATVPPPAAVPDAPGIPAEAFKVSHVAEPVWTTRPTPEKKKVSRGWQGFAVLLFLLVGGAVAIWQLGFAEELLGLAKSFIGGAAQVVESPDPASQPATVAEPDELPAVAEAADEAGDPSQADAIEDTEPVKDSQLAADSEAPAEEAVAVAAQPGIVQFQVTSRPSGAFVSINGKGAGRTPLDLEYEVGTKLSLFSKARGYLARRQRLVVAADQAAVNLVLAPLPYVVEVSSHPPGARASAVGGGEVITPGVLRFKWIPGSRKILVSKEGYETASASVRRADFTEETQRMTISVEVTLQKETEASRTSDATSKEDSAPAEPPDVATQSEATTDPQVDPVSAEVEPMPNPVPEAPPEREPTVVDAAPAPTEPGAAEVP